MNVFLNIWINLVYIRKKYINNSKVCDKSDISKHYIYNSIELDSNFA